LTFGLSYFLTGAGLAIFGGRFVSVPFLTGAFQVGPLSIPQARLLAFGVAVVLSARVRVSAALDRTRPSDPGNEPEPRRRAGLRTRRRSRA